MPFRTQLDSLLLSDPDPGTGIATDSSTSQTMGASWWGHHCHGKGQHGGRQGFRLTAALALSFRSCPRMTNVCCRAILVEKALPLFKTGLPPAAGKKALHALHALHSIACIAQHCMHCTALHALHSIAVQCRALQCNAGSLGCSCNAATLVQVAARR
jgi:hypothetical protein